MLHIAVEALLSRGASINIKDAHNKTAMQVCKDARVREIMQIFAQDQQTDVSFSMDPIAWTHPQNQLMSMKSIVVRVAYLTLQFLQRRVIRSELVLCTDNCWKHDILFNIIFDQPQRIRANLKNGWVPTRGPIPLAPDRACVQSSVFWFCPLPVVLFLFYRKKCFLLCVEILFTRGHVRETMFVSCFLAAGEHKTGRGVALPTDQQVQRHLGPRLSLGRRSRQGRGGGGKHRPQSAGGRTLQGTQTFGTQTALFCHQIWIPSSRVPESPFPLHDLRGTVPPCWGQGRRKFSFSHKLMSEMKSVLPERLSSRQISDTLLARTERTNDFGLRRKVP